MALYEALVIALVLVRAFTGGYISSAISPEVLSWRTSLDGMCAHHEAGVSLLLSGMSAERSFLCPLAGVGSSGRRNGSIRCHGRDWALRRRCRASADPLCDFDFVADAEDGAGRAGAGVLAEDRFV